MQTDLAAFIEHTLLKAEATDRDIIRLCEEALSYRFAAVCVNPYFVKTAAAKLGGTPVKVCAVVGFPLGANTVAVRVAEAAGAVADGAAEIDLVMNIGAFRGGERDYVLRELQALVAAAAGRPVKVIIETALLTKKEKIAACLLAQKAGARFVKTSTGFGPGGATVADVRLMRETVGPQFGIKAAGGVRTREEALALIAAGATSLGTSAGAAIMEK